VNGVENCRRFTQPERVKLIRLFLTLGAMALLGGCQKQTPAPLPGITPVHWEPTQAQPRLPTVNLWVGPAQITAEVASKPVEIMTGMMFRTNIVENEGMLFLLGEPQRAAFWMKNCPQPLSCAYIDPQGTILEIRKMEPNDTNSIVANSDNVLFVLETARGWFERHGVRTNMLIQTDHGPLSESFYGRPKP
jgi:uncharacterized membrane protein (UPF0127 family)